MVDSCASWVGASLDQERSPAENFHVAAVEMPMVVKIVTAFEKDESVVRSPAGAPERHTGAFGAEKDPRGQCGV